MPPGSRRQRRASSAWQTLWVNFSALGVGSDAKLDWVARHVANELHSAPATSVAILIYTDRISNDFAGQHLVGFRVEHGDSDVEYAWRQSKLLRQWRHKIEETFSEARFNLMVTDAQIIFRPDTVWVSRPSHHGILVVLPRSVLPSVHQSSSTPTTASSVATSSIVRQPNNDQSARPAAERLQEQRAHEDWGCHGRAHAVPDRFQGCSSNIVLLVLAAACPGPACHPNSQHRSCGTLSPITASAWRTITCNTLAANVWLPRAWMP